MVGDVSHVKKTYIAQKGVYLQSDGETEYDYSEKEQNINDMIVNSGGEAVNNQTETTEATTDVSVETNESDNILSI
jgi:hypothetical protein